MTWGVVFKYSRVTIVENTISNWPKLQGPSFWEMIAFFIGTSKFGSILLQWLLTYLNLTLDAENLFCLYKQKKWFLLWAAQAAETIEKTLYYIYSTISLLFYVLFVKHSWQRVSNPHFMKNPNLLLTHPLFTLPLHCCFCCLVSLAECVTMPYLMCYFA